MKAIVFFIDIKKDGGVIYKRGKHYHYEKEDLDYFYIKTEDGDVDTIHKANCNIMYMIVEEDYLEEFH